MRLAHCLVIVVAMGMGCSKFDAASEPDDGGAAVAEGGPADPSDAGDGGDAACVMGAMYFDGVKSRIDIAHRTELDLTDQLTVEAWIRPSEAVLTQGAEMHILSHHSFADREGWLLAIQGRRIELRLHGTGGNNGVAIAGDEGPPYVEADRWAHVAGTLGTASKLRVFYDGVERATATVPPGFTRKAGKTQLVIGSSGGNSPTPFQGFIYGVRITPSAIYTSPTLDVPRPPLAGLPNSIALFLLDEESGMLAVDSLGMQANLKAGTDLAIRKNTACIPP